MKRPPTDRVRAMRQDGPFELHGHMFVYEEGRWRQWVVRRWMKSGSYDFAELQTVDASAPICLACLSNAVTVHDAGGFEWHECHGCGLLYHIVRVP